MRTVAIMILLFLASFTGTAFAAQVVSPDDGSVLDYLQPVLSAVAQGQWSLAAACVVVLLCAVARRYLPAKWKEGVRGDIVGTALAFLMAAAGAVAAAVAVPGAVLSAAVFMSAFKVGVLAIGGYTTIHKIAGWLAGWEKSPAWLTTILRIVTAIIGSSAMKKAEAAGDKAVAAQPSTGMKGNDDIEEVE